MNNIPKKVLAIHDLSTYGRCSLGVIIPILSVMGLQVCSLPAAVLSTHTGGYNDFYMQGLSEFIKQSCEHFKTLSVSFDAVYSGFLAGADQIDQLRYIIDTYKYALILIDPVMGDNGKVYKTYTKELCELMKKLVKKADIITPNLTECSILLDIPYKNETLTDEYIKDMLLKLNSMGPSQIVVTGIRNCEDIINAAYDKNLNKFYKIKSNYKPIHYPGTGDIFSSVLLSEILLDKPLDTALKSATEFIDYCINITPEKDYDHREGVLLENALIKLINKSDSLKIIEF